MRPTTARCDGRAPRLDRPRRARAAPAERRAQRDAQGDVHALAAAAENRVGTRPDQALLLALAGYASSPSADARNAVVTALEKARQLGVSEFVPAHCSPKTTKRADQLVGELVALDADGRTVAKHRSDPPPSGRP